MSIKDVKLPSSPSLVIDRDEKQDEGSLLPPLSPRGRLLRRPQVQERADLLHLHRHHHRPGQLHHQRHDRGPDRAVRQGALPRPWKPSRGVPGGAVQRADGVPAARHHRRLGQRQLEPSTSLHQHRRLPLNIVLCSMNIPLNIGGAHFV